jgi:16S rRNA processing protein RimM
MLMSTLLMTDSFSDSAEERLLEVGRIGKPHGVKGDVFVMFVSDREERRMPGAEFIARSPDKKDSRSRRLGIKTARAQKDRYVIHFEGVNDRNDAELLTNVMLYAEPIDDDDAVWVHEVIGSQVCAIDGTRYGICTAVIDNPAHAILELDNGALVPMPFVVGYENGVTTINPPPGLFEDIDPTAS